MLTLPDPQLGLGPREDRQDRRQGHPEELMARRAIPTGPVGLRRLDIDSQAGKDAVFPLQFEIRQISSGVLYGRHNQR